MSHMRVTTGDTLAGDDACIRATFGAHLLVCANAACMHSAISLPRTGHSETHWLSCCLSATMFVWLGLQPSVDTKVDRRNIVTLEESNM